MNFQKEYTLNIGLNSKKIIFLLPKNETNKEDSKNNKYNANRYK